MKYVSGETIIDITKKYVEVYYNKLGNKEKNILDKDVEDFTGFSNYLELIEYLFNSSDTHYPDLYNCDEGFIHSDFLAQVVVNGKPYSMYACWVTFGGFCPYISNLYFMAVVPCFAYYEFVEQTNTDGTVGSNMKAEKMYSYEIKKVDYPEWVNIMKKSDILKLVPKKTRSL